jgi:hypothetical protein
MAAAWESCRHFLPQLSALRTWLVQLGCCCFFYMVTCQNERPPNKCVACFCNNRNRIFQTLSSLPESAGPAATVTVWSEHPLPYGPGGGGVPLSTNHFYYRKSLHFTISIELRPPKKSSHHSLTAEDTGHNVSSCRVQTAPPHPLTNQPSPGSLPAG